MKKVLSLVLAFTLVLGMMPTAFAAETGSAGEMLLQYKFINGGTNGELMEDKALDREQFAVILATLNGKEEEAKKFEGALNFKDADKISKWAVPYVAYAVEQNWLKGNDKNEFMPAQTLTGQEILSSLLRVLGYTVEWANVVKEAETLGFTATEGELNRGQAFETLWKVVKEIPAKGADQPLGVALGKLEAEKPVVKELDFTVTATDLKEVKVEFNQEVNKETVLDANFVIKKGTATKAASATLLADNKTVVLSVKELADGKLDNQAAYTLTVEKVKSAAGTEIAKTTKDFTSFDGTLPTVEKLTYTGPKQLELTFSEPVTKSETTRKITIKSGNSSLSVDYNNIAGMGTNVLQVPLFSTLVDKTTYSVTVEGVNDFAGYQNVVKTFEQEYIKDVTPPTAKVVKATQEYVVVEFDKPVTGVTNKHFSHTFTAWTAVKVTAVEDITKDTVSKGTKFVVWFNDATATTTEAKALNRPIEAGTRTLNILGKASSVEIADLWSNKFAETKLTFEVSADTTAPAVKELKVASETAFTVEFTKLVSFSKDNVEVLDKDGKAISGIYLTVTQDANNSKKYSVSFGKNLKGQTVIINIKNVKDVSLLTNAMPTFTVTETIQDKTAPVVSKVTYAPATDVTVGPNYLYVFFDENVDSATALNKANYQMVNSNKFVTLTNEPVFVNGSKTVRFTLTKTEREAIVLNSTQILVSNVKDAFDNTIAVALSATNNVVAHDANVIPTMTKAHATSATTVVVTFSEELGSVDREAFLVNAKAPITMDVTLVDGKTQVTLTLADADKLALDTTGVNVSYAAGKNTLIKNLFAVSPASNETEVVVDKIAPKLITDTDSVKAIRLNAGKIEIEFTEALESADAALVTLFAQDIMLVKGADTLVPGVDFTVTLANANKTLVIGTGVAAADALADGIYQVSSKDSITYLQDVNNVLATKFTTAKELTNTNAATFTINYTTEMTQQAVPATVEYRVNGGTWTQDGAAAIAVAPGSTYEFRVKETATEAAGPIATLVANARPALGTITIDATNTAAAFVLVNGVRVTAAQGYESTVDGGTNWVAIGDATTFNVSAAGTLTVRVKATLTTFASASSADLNAN